MGEFIRQLPGEGRQPRVMLDYSGTLLHGMRQMGLDDVFDALGYLTRDLRARQAVEWLGCTWGHAVAPSTPSRTCGCTCAPGSTISLPSSALRRSGASADSPPPRWRCPTTPMSPARSSAPWLTAAISGCSSRSTPRSSPTAAASAAPAGVHRLERPMRSSASSPPSPRGGALRAVRRARQLPYDQIPPGVLAREPGPLARSCTSAIQSGQPDARLRTNGAKALPRDSHRTGGVRLPGNQPLHRLSSSPHGRAGT